MLGDRESAERQSKYQVYFVAWSSALAGLTDRSITATLSEEEREA